MRRALAALTLLFAFLLCFAGTASAYVDVGAKNRVGGFGADPAFYTGGFDSLALDAHQEITILCYDPATDVWFYVRQNPWTSFDPLGLEMKIETKDRDDGGKHSKMEFTAKVYDKTGSMSKKELEYARNEIEAGLKETFTNASGDHTWEISVNLTIAESAKDIDLINDSAHLYQFVDSSELNPDSKALTITKGRAGFGGKLIKLNRSLVSEEGMERAAVIAKGKALGIEKFQGFQPADSQFTHAAVHEAGHTLGLFHASNPASWNHSFKSELDGAPVFMGSGRSNPLKNLSDNNFMRYPHPIKHILDNPLFDADPAQIQRIQKYCNEGLLNGSARNTEEFK